MVSNTIKNRLEIEQLQLSQFEVLLSTLGVAVDLQKGEVVQ